MNSREAAAILARARSTLVLLEAAETEERVKRLHERAAPLIIYKTKEDALVAPRLRYRVQHDARLR